MRVAIAFIAGLIIGAAGGILGYTFFVGGSGEPTTELSDAAETLTVAEDSSDGAAETALFRIQTEPSQVSFSLEEDLRGQRVTVLGETDQVAADIVVNFDDPQASEIGTVTINARSLATDNTFRNRALRSNILLSSQDQYEFITFEPTALNGLPEAIEVGETYNVEIVGDLEIIGRSNEVTFDAELTLEDESTLTGTATANVLYADWEITIPNAPGVANVTDDVTLTINFTAQQVDE